MINKLVNQFTEEFFEEFQYDAEFRSIFFAMEEGMTPYTAIEHLCTSKKRLMAKLTEAINNVPREIIVTTEKFKQIKQKIDNNGKQKRS